VPGGGGAESPTKDAKKPATATTATGAAVEAVPDVSMAEAIRSPQFHLLGITFTALATGGMGIFSVAKPMMSEVLLSML
jgi:hypothetical protein